MNDGGPKSEILPVLAARDLVMFPGVITSLRVGRRRFLAALAEAEAGDGHLVILAQRDPTVDQPGEADLYDVGTVCQVTTTDEKSGPGRIVAASSMARCRIVRFTQWDPHVAAEVAPLEDVDTDLPSSLRHQIKALLAASHGGQPLLAILESLPAAAELDGIAAFQLSLTVDDKQKLLAEPSVLNRYRMLVPVLRVEVEIAEAGELVRHDKRYEVSVEERREYLEERKRDMMRELEELNGKGGETEKLRERLEAVKLLPAARTEADRELKRLAGMEPGAPEYGVATDYLGWLAALPWDASTEAHIDVPAAQRILDRDHYDREEVKERVLEYLSVQALKPDQQGAILCFVGAPGVGKTSMGRSIAEATGRKFYRVSLGGVRDEAEIRGHRRTYIGALPGCIIRALRRTEVNNPLIMLDEVDKLAAGARGDPTSALLEVLDPAENHSFTDNYIAVPFDLSRVLFIGTANTAETIPPALLDRLEVIELPGYTAEEKVAIARGYLVPRQLDASGLEPGGVDLDDEALALLAERYTREAGVRELERCIAAVCRKLAREFISGHHHYTQVDRERVLDLLGPPTYAPRTAEKGARPGICPTLVVSPAGGMLLNVEVTRVEGSGKLTVTGRVGEALGESARMALDYWRSRAVRFGLDPEMFGSSDFHVHFPGGAVPKEGTAAGLPVALALGSALLGRPLPDGMAALGSITLHGQVLEVTRLEERLAAAHRAGIDHVLLPEKCRATLAHARNRRLIEHLKVTCVRTLEDAVSAVLPGALRETAPAI